MTELNSNKIDLKNYMRKVVAFDVSGPNATTVENELKQGWSIVHLSNRGKNFIGILEKNFIAYDESNNPTVYIPPRKKIKW
jgi:hypothetical protein